MTKDELQQLKRNAGKAPFTDRLRFSGGFAKCPFHEGDSDKSMHLFRADDGTWLVTCFSTCSRSWDAIAFIQQKDGVDFAEAVRQLGGGTPMPEPEKQPEQPKMTPEQWANFGREVTQADIDRLAKSREERGYTAGLESWQALGARVEGDFLWVPAKVSVYDPDTGTTRTKFYLAKGRHLDRKEFIQKAGKYRDGLFGLDSIDFSEDAFVVEGQPDQAAMIEAGYITVSPSTGGQKKFDAYAIKRLSEASRIFLIGDQPDAFTDESDPGQGCMDALQKLLPSDRTYRIGSIGAHDVSELRKKLGSAEAFQARIDECVQASLAPWIRRAIPSVDRLSQEPVKWNIDRFIPYGGLTQIAGPAGSKKSFLALYMAKALTSSWGGTYSFRNLPNVVEEPGQFLGRAVPQAVPVLYLDRENAQAIAAERLRNIGIIPGLNAREWQGSRFTIPAKAIATNPNFLYWGDWHDEPTPEPDDPRLLEFARKEHALIIFDSLQDWYPASFSEIDNAQIVQLMNRFRRLAHAGAGVIYQHHTPQMDSGRARGGTAFTALTDMAFNVRPPHGNEDEDDPYFKDTLYIREERFRMCPSWEMDVRFHWSAEDANGQKFYWLELLRDQTTPEAIETKKTEQKQKAAERSAKDVRDFERLEKLICGNPALTAKTLANKIDSTEKRVNRLLEDKGLTWNGEEKCWTGGGLLFATKTNPSDEGF